MAVDLIGPLGDPQKDAAAIKPVLDSLLDRILMALAAALRGAADGLLSQVLGK
jgi:hypothetical protein